MRSHDEQLQSGKELMLIEVFKRSRKHNYCYTLRLRVKNAEISRAIRACACVHVKCDRKIIIASYKAPEEIIATCRHINLASYTSKFEVITVQDNIIIRMVRK